MTRDNDIDRLLRRQHGAVSRAQLRERGVNANSIDTWVRRSRLRRILPSVYCTGPPSLAARAHAAHLWQPKGVATLTSERALRMRYVEDLGLRGSPHVAQQLASLVPGAASAPERLLAQGLSSAGLTDFLVNEPVHGYIADFLDPVRRLILEVDGYRTHGSWVAFQNDRTRQNVLVAHGYTVLRYTAHDVQTRLGSILDEITDMVARTSQQTS
ncbi:MAG TPA: type IV toxin-antitoxin system AbiEi family antitoxin domain-containing protein [Pseudonocardiaceae bacterium]|nr:type IV toxin-antitoxin system AbiEi family antitoxin domain-containing protein [Pseudonocardiaceae bacterium]